jgi:hypothetical protein
MAGDLAAARVTESGALIEYRDRFGAAARAIRRWPPARRRHYDDARRSSPSRSGEIQTSVVNYFTSWCAQRGREPLPCRATDDHGYLSELAPACPKAGTMSRRLTAIKLA